MSRHLVPRSALVLAIGLAFSAPALAGERPTPTQKLHRAVALRDAGIVLTSAGLASSVAVNVWFFTEPWPMEGAYEGYGAVYAYALAVPSAAVLVGVPMWAVGQHRAHVARVVVAPTFIPHGAGAAFSVVW